MQTVQASLIAWNGDAGNISGKTLGFKQGEFPDYFNLRGRFATKLFRRAQPLPDAKGFEYRCSDNDGLFTVAVTFA